MNNPKINQVILQYFHEIGIDNYLCETTGEAKRKIAELIIQWIDDVNNKCQILEELANANIDKAIELYQNTTNEHFTISFIEPNKPIQYNEIKALALKKLYQ